MLNIYVEKEFLDNFYLDYDEGKASKVQNIVYKILVDYPETKWFLDCAINSIDDLEKLKNENPIIAAKSANSIAPYPIASIEKEVLKQATAKTSIVFMAEKQDWFGQAEKLGVLCFSSENYELKIREIIDTYHYKIDLSEKGFDWGKLKFLPTLNHIKINDNYLLVDKDSQKIDQNLSVLLKNIIDEYDRIANIEIYTKNLNPKQPGGENQVKDAAKEKNQKINRVFANYKAKFKIINNSVSTVSSNFHDRMILTNFQIVDCGIGFNLIPHKVSNSQIVSETIFELYTYRRLKNLATTHNKYLARITSESFQTTEFTYICLPPDTEISSQ